MPGERGKLSVKRYEDFTKGLQEEVAVPEKVWERYLDTLDHIETLAEERKGADVMGRKRTKRTWVRAAAAAGVLMAGTAVFACVDPVAASELPIIGRVFERIAENATYSGDYSGKTVLQENNGQSTEEERGVAAKPEGIYTVSDNGITISASEVYSDGYSVYLAVEVVSEEGGFSGIPAYYTRRFEEKTSQMIRAEGVWKTGEEGEAVSLYNHSFEGSVVDDHTFIGMMKLDQIACDSAENMLNLELTEIRYERGEAFESEGSDPEQRIQGAWMLQIPFTADTEKSREIVVDKTGEDGLCIQKVFVSPYQVIVFTDTPYTTWSADTYTEADFEAQWGEKNEEILAKGGQPVTYEEMLAKERYENFELAVYNQDGEALAMQYGDPQKTVFAVQGLELTKLHIYAADDSDAFGLIKAENEQEARDMSVLDAEVEW